MAQFGDGFAYSKQRMDEAIRSGLFDKPPPKAAKEVYAVKKEDVDLIVRLVLRSLHPALASLHR